jgi:hypothetical protein
MVKQPASCKYTPLESYFRSLPASQTELVLSINQIETIMQSKLPRSAYERGTWWDNEVHSTLSHKNAWLHAGWNVKSTDLEGQKIKFVRAA